MIANTDITGLIPYSIHSPPRLREYHLVENRTKDPAATGIWLLSSTCRKSTIDGAPKLDASGGFSDNTCLSRRPNYLTQSPCVCRILEYMKHISHPMNSDESSIMILVLARPIFPICSSPCDSIPSLTHASSSKASK